MPDDAARFAFPPRLLRTAAAAYYCGMGETTFRERVMQAVPRVTIGGVRGWLREASKSARRIKSLSGDALANRPLGINGLRADSQTSAGAVTRHRSRSSRSPVRSRAGAAQAWRRRGDRPARRPVRAARPTGRGCRRGLFRPGRRAPGPRQAVPRAGRCGLTHKPQLRRRGARVLPFLRVSPDPVPRQPRRRGDHLQNPISAPQNDERPRCGSRRGALLLLAGSAPPSRPAGHQVSLLELLLIIPHRLAPCAARAPEDLARDGISHAALPAAAEAQQLRGEGRPGADARQALRGLRDHGAPGHD